MIEAYYLRWKIAREQFKACVKKEIYGSRRDFWALRVSANYIHLCANVPAQLMLWEKQMRIEGTL